MFRLLSCALAIVLFQWVVPVSAQGLNYFYCYVPSPQDGKTFLSDVQPVGPVAERRTYGDEFVAYLQSKGKVTGRATGYCVMRSTMREIDRGRAEMAQTTCMECQGAEKVQDVAWARDDAKVQPASADEKASIADAFKAQNDAEWGKLGKYVRKPREGSGPMFGYCYQYSYVDSVLYQSGIFPTDKQNATSTLELAFADKVARITNVAAAMSTHCYVSSDTGYLTDIRYGVAQVRASDAKDFVELSPPT